MSQLAIDFSTYSVPENLALLYIEEDVFKSKLEDSTVSEITEDTLSKLGVTSTDLPCLVYASDLQTASNDSSTTVGNNNCAAERTAAFVVAKKLIDQKANKSDVLSRVEAEKIAREAADAVMSADIEVLKLKDTYQKVLPTEVEVNCVPNMWYICKTGCKLILPSADVTEGQSIKITILESALKYSVSSVDEETGETIETSVDTCITGGVINGSDGVIVDIPQNLELMYINDTWLVIGRHTI